ncbi:hypothetical protein PR048_015808 [Dryococelus australis]|uniref:Uncharacterized protein n=1 Tax=Dryococelus australis TaxID=614101 RepID=A0ABQ9HHZ1_9NEOP|nr:hypothetical protein PR048_015808 [Dryococelus australis]
MGLNSQGGKGPCGGLVTWVEGGGGRFKASKWRRAEESGDGTVTSGHQPRPLLVTSSELVDSFELRLLNPVPESANIGQNACLSYSEHSSIPGGVAPGSSHLLDDAAGRRVFSGISRFPRPDIPALLHTHLTSPSSALKTSLLRVSKTSPCQVGESVSQNTCARSNGTTVDERLAYSPPAKANRAQSPAWVTIFSVRGNRAGRCRWSAGFLGPLHCGCVPYSLQSPSSALKTSLGRRNLYTSSRVLQTPTDEEESQQHIYSLVIMFARDPLVRALSELSVRPRICCADKRGTWKGEGAADRLYMGWHPDRRVTDSRSINRRIFDYTYSAVFTRAAVVPARAANKTTLNAIGCPFAVAARQFPFSRFLTEKSCITGNRLVSEEQKPRQEFRTWIGAVGVWDDSLPSPSLPPLHNEESLSRAVGVHFLLRIPNHKVLLSKVSAKASFITPAGSFQNIMEDRRVKTEVTDTGFRYLYWHQFKVKIMGNCITTRRNTLNTDKLKAAEEQ